MSEVFKYVAGPVAIAALAISGSYASKESGVKTVESRRSVESTELDVALSRSYANQPVLVEDCPEGGEKLPQGSLVQADILGRNGSHITYIVVGDLSKKPVYAYDINGDGNPEAWCGEVSDSKDPNTGLYSPAPDRSAPAYLVIPNWEDCKMPAAGEKFDCPGSPLVWEPNAYGQAPDTTIEPLPTPNTILNA
ncbi:MAG: hypothetical protein JWO47_509 [Candidatus Saccharibacteria bacterium]|nr:hypothetical protein [Candidatus Saccharibacteria bacterium]